MLIQKLPGLKKKQTILETWYLGGVFWNQRLKVRNWIRVVK